MKFIDFFTAKSYYKWLFNCTKLIQIREFTEINTQINISKEAIPTQVLSILTDHGRTWLDKNDQGWPWSTMVSRNFIRFDHGQPWTTMVRTMALSWYLMVDHDHGRPWSSFRLGWIKPFAMGELHFHIFREFLALSLKLLTFSDGRKIVTICIPGQSCVLHVWVFVALPTQSAPLPVGVGFVQVLVPIENPVPHDSLQVLQSVKLVHPPSSEWRQCYQYYKEFLNALYLYKNMSVKERYYIRIFIFIYINDLHMNLNATKRPFGYFHDSVGKQCKSRKIM